MTAARTFLKALAARRLSNTERAVALLWWHSREDHVAASTPSELASEIQLAGYSKQNPSRLREGLQKDRRTAAAGKGAFRIRIDCRDSLDEEYGPLAASDDSAPARANEARRPASSKSSASVARPNGTTARIFIGSSVEGLKVARALQEELEHTAESTLWSQGLFGLSGGTLETLADAAHEFDFAALVLSPDDMVQKRGATKPSARDNVVFELGLFVGAIGRKRTFIIYPRDVEMHLPSDLAGVTPATYASNRSDGNLLAALGPVCSKITREIERFGARADKAG